MSIWSTQAWIVPVHSIAYGMGDRDVDSAPIPGIVCDPFAGSGTTLAAAIGCGRDAIGIDLDDRNATLAAERCGMFLEIAS